MRTVTDWGPSARATASTRSTSPPTRPRWPCSPRRRGRAVRGERPRPRATARRGRRDRSDRRLDERQPRHAVVRHVAVPRRRRRPGGGARRQPGRRRALLGACAARERGAASAALRPSGCTRLGEAIVVRLGRSARRRRLGAVPGARALRARPVRRGRRCASTASSTSASTSTACGTTSAAWLICREAGIEVVDAFDRRCCTWTTPTAAPRSPRPRRAADAAARRPPPKCVTPMHDVASALRTSSASSPLRACRLTTPFRRAHSSAG